MGELFGNSTYAISTVIAAFMAGLALGSWYGGKFNKRRSNPLLYYLLLEFGIGFSALLISYLMLNIDQVYSLTYSFFNRSLTSLVVIRFIFGFILILLPTAMMGATLPTISKYIIRNFSKLGADYSILYSVNTLGGLTGIVLSAFFMIEYFGLFNTLYFAIALNFIVGATVYLFYFRSENTGRLVENTVEREGNSEPVSDTVNIELGKYKLNIIAIIAFITGFTSFAFEILWTRSLVFFIGTSTYSYSLILILFLFGIAAGSVLIKKFADRIKNFWKVIIITQSVIIISSVSAIYLFSYIFHIDFFKPGHSTWISYLSINLLKVSLVIFIPSFFMGITFPLLNKVYVNKIENVSNKIGNLYAVNTIGSIFGSLITGFILIPLLGINRSIVFISFILFALVSYLVIRFLSSRKFRFLKPVFPIIGTLCFVALFRMELPPYISYDEKDVEDILFYEEGVSATTKVYTDPDGFMKMTVNGVLMGGDFEKAMRKQKMLAYLPLLLKPEVENIYVVGLGTGITLKEFINLAGTARIDCAEICPSVINGSKLFIDEMDEFIDSPNIRIIMEDGKNYLKLTDRKYDIISSDTMLKRGSAGNGIMYSKEYYDLCNQHLTDGGIFLQWVPLYLGEEIHKMIIRTALRSFNYTSLWYVGDEAMVQVSSNKPLSINYEKFISKFHDPEYSASLAEIDFVNPESILSIFFLDRDEIESFVGDGDINSVLYPYVEFKTPRDFGAYRNVFRNLSKLSKLKKSILDSPDILSVDDISGDARNSIRKYESSFYDVVEGLKYSYTGDTFKSKQMFARALFRNPSDPNAKHYLGISDSREDSPRKARALLEYGIILSDVNQDSLAIRIFRKSLSINPDNVLTLNKLSLSLAKTGNIEEAVNTAERIVEINPNNFIANFNLAIFYEQAGKLKEALQMYRRCIRIDPSSKTVRQNISRLKTILSVN